MMNKTALCLMLGTMNALLGIYVRVGGGNVVVVYSFRDRMLYCVCIHSFLVERLHAKEAEEVDKKKEDRVLCTTKKKRLKSSQMQNMYILCIGSLLNMFCCKGDEM